MSIKWVSEIAKPISSVQACRMTFKEVFPRPHRRALPSAGQCDKRRTGGRFLRFKAPRSPPAQPGAMQAKLDFRKALSRRFFFDFLQKAIRNCRVPDTKLFGKKFSGRLDCLLSIQGNKPSSI